MRSVQRLFPWHETLWIQGTRPQRKTLRKESGEEGHGGKSGGLLRYLFVLLIFCILSTAGIVRKMVVRLGKYNLEKDEAFAIDVKPTLIRNHPAYVVATYDSDLALIKLKDKVTFTDYIMPICLPRTQSDYDLIRPGNEGIITGWGARKETGKSVRKLHEVKVPVVDTPTCQRSHPKYTITANMFCAGTGSTSTSGDACQGDSGGPLSIDSLTTGSRRRHVLLGVISWGEGCGRVGKYGVYTRLTKSFVKWIKQESTLWARGSGLFLGFLQHPCDLCLDSASFAALWKIKVFITAATFKMVFFIDSTVDIFPLNFSLLFVGLFSLCAVLGNKSWPPVFTREQVIIIRFDLFSCLKWFPRLYKTFIHFALHFSKRVGTPEPISPVEPHLNDLKTRRWWPQALSSSQEILKCSRFWVAFASRYWGPDSKLPAHEKLSLSQNQTQARTRKSLLDCHKINLLLDDITFRKNNTQGVSYLDFRNQLFSYSDWADRGSSEETWE